MDIYQIRDILKPGLLDGVTISAVCDKKGKISPVSNDSVDPKINTAKSQRNIVTILFSKNQKNKDNDKLPAVIKRDVNDPNLVILTAENLEESILKLYQHSKPRREWVEKQKMYATLQLMDGTEISWDYYIKTDLLPYKTINTDTNKYEHDYFVSSIYYNTPFADPNSISFKFFVDSIKEKQYFLIIDSSGQGKSTFLKYLVHQIDKLLLIPVKIDCVDWEKSGETLIQFIFKLDGYNAQWLKESILLLDQIDALDEKSIAVLKKSLLEIKKAGCGIIATCRNDSSLEQHQDILQLFNSQCFKLRS